MQIEGLRIRTIEEANLHLAQLQGLMRDPGPTTPLLLMQQFNEFSYACVARSDSWVWQMILSGAGNYVRVEDHARLNALMAQKNVKAEIIIIPTHMSGLPTVTVVQRKAQGLAVLSLQLLLQTDNSHSLDSIPLLVPLTDTNWQLFLREKNADTALSFLS